MGLSLHTAFPMSCVSPGVVACDFNDDYSGNTTIACLLLLFTKVYFVKTEMAFFLAFSINISNVNHILFLVTRSCCYLIQPASSSRNNSYNLCTLNKLMQHIH